MKSCFSWMLHTSMIIVVFLMMKLLVQIRAWTPLINAQAGSQKAISTGVPKNISESSEFILTKLNAPLPYQAHVSNFQISPNSVYVVYKIDMSGDPDELWSVPLIGGTPMQINGPLSEFDYVISFQISSDSQWVVYTANYDGDWQIFSVPITGGTAVQLNGPLVNGGNVGPNQWEYAISPDSTRVVYVAEQETNEVWELFSVPISGGTAVKLNGPMVAGGDITPRTSYSTYWFDISPDSQRVVYTADQEVDNDIELYSVPIGGGTAIKLNSPLATSTISGDVIGDVHAYQISVDGTQLIYFAYLEGDNGIELHSVPITGGTTVSFEGAPSFQGALDLRFALSSDGSRVVYHPREDQLFSVPLSGEAPIQLNDPILGVVIEFAITPDSMYVVYTASRSENYQFIREIFSVPIGGGASLRLHQPFGPGGTVFNDWKISADSTRVVFSAEPENSDPAGVYSAAVAQGTAIHLSISASFFPGEQIISPNSQWVAYAAIITSDVGEIFRVPVIGGESTKLNPLPINTLADLYSFEFSPHSACVVFIYGIGDANGAQLYAACEYNFDQFSYLPFIRK